MTAWSTLDVDLLLGTKGDGVEDCTQKNQEVGCDEDVEKGGVEAVRGGYRDRANVGC
jgi:hypothetical protein